jgi:non-lysosomal glucosylceramidase
MNTHSPKSLDSGLQPTTIVRAEAADGASGPGGGSFARRDFLRLLGVSATAALAFRPWPHAMAGPFTRADFGKLVPEDKKLSPEWIKSLTARGEREVYRGADLAKIGMPAGGICAGQVYLGGDGRLWHWDIFNQHLDTGSGGPHYAKPMEPRAPFEQGFALRVTAGGQTRVRSLDRSGWSDISFCGEYPLGFVEYRDPESPVVVSLESFSPFIPLNTADSSLPATVMRFTVKNTSAAPAVVEVGGWLENAVCLQSGKERPVQRRNRVIRREGLVALECSAEDAPVPPGASPRPDILFDDFEREGYGDWTATGTAFGQGPVSQSQVPDYQGALGMRGERTVNTHSAAPASDVEARDSHQGTLTSKPFVIERDFISFLVGGGAHKDRTCINLLVEDQVVLTATGKNDNRMALASWNVRAWAGKTARIQVVDRESGGWGQIGLDHIVFTDQPRAASGPLTQEADFGTMTLTMLKTESRVLPGPDGEVRDFAATALPADSLPPGMFFRSWEARETATAPFGQKMIGCLTRAFTLQPGGSQSVTFVVTWHFPNLNLRGVRLPEIQIRRGLGHPGQGRYYAAKFASALEVASYLAANFPRLAAETRLWHDTWYNSTLPYWFLDRTFLNTSILATSTCYRFADGRFWAWEGVGCCAGTCGHVWQYAQAMGRAFPELERAVRERTDFGFALQPDGAIYFRGENNNIPAVDGQAGTILRALREHQMTPDDAWLRSQWPQIKRATQWLIAKDGDSDGLITGNQHNTLDTDWFGPVAWLSGLYLAALLAAAEMADVVGDREFAAQCRAIVDKGRPKLVAELFDGEYFINKPDPQKLDAINSGTGCHIDQVFGQSYAFQVGLPRVLPEKETKAALAALWRYNFTPDVGPYRAAYKPGRWYAMPGEAGLLMCSFPRTDWDYAQAKGKGPEWAAGYFNECMNGFEYQVAGHMLWEGLITEGLAVTRAIHDRYHPSRRNPWNEIECGDHYARSMASYGVFLAACGYEYDGPKAALALAPRLTPEDFKAAFTTAEGWGSFSQQAEGGRQKAEVEMKYGQLRLKTLALTLPANLKPQKVSAVLAGKTVPATLAVRDGRCLVQFAAEVTIATGKTLQVSF